MSSSTSYFLTPHLPPMRRLSSSQIKPKLLTCKSISNHHLRPHHSDTTLSSPRVIAPTYCNSSRRCVKVRSSFNFNFSFPLVSPSDHWGNWTALFSIGAIGSWILSALPIQELAVLFLPDELLTQAKRVHVEKVSNQFKEDFVLLTRCGSFSTKTRYAWASNSSGKIKTVSYWMGNPSEAKQTISWSEKTTVGNMLSGALMSTLIGLVASNLGIISSEAHAYSIVLDYLLPLAVPLLLFRADMFRVIKSTGTLLLAFLVGSVATTVGTVVAYWMVPMRPLGREGWKIAAALMGRHIGGAVNYVAIAEALQISPSVLAAGLAADNVICAVYFATLFALAAKIAPESSPSITDGEEELKSESGSNLSLLQSATALAISFAICKLGSFVTKYFAIQGGILPAVTAIVVVLATVFPKQFTHLAPAGEVMAMILMQVFFTVVGASGNLWNVINTAPSIFLFALVQLAVHLAVILGLGKVFGFELRLLLLASNANVGGPTTACGMATAKGWSSLAVPGILAGIFGIAIATFLGVAFGVKVLQYM